MDETRQASSVYGSGAGSRDLQRSDLAETDVLILLGNLGTSPEILLGIGSNPRWTRWYSVRKGLVQHPRAPLHVSRRLLPHLFWKELVETGTDLRLHPVLRRQADELLKVRQQSLTLGEKIALARRATRSVIPAMIESGDTKVHVSLLGNPRLCERDAIAIAESERSARESLTVLARHPRWSNCRQVRFAVMENPRTPVAIALSLLQNLPTMDLRRVVRNARVPRLIRIGAERAMTAAPTYRCSAWGSAPRRP